MNLRSIARLLILAQFLLLAIPAPKPVQAITSAAKYGGFLFAWEGQRYLQQNEHENEGVTPGQGGAVDIIYGQNDFRPFPILAPKDGVVIDMADSFPETVGKSCTVTFTKTGGSETFWPGNFP